MSDLEAELRQRGVVRSGHFELSSGRHSDTYLQCALALQDPAFAGRLGRALADLLAVVEPQLVVSPALGGVLAGFVTAQALGVRFVFTERQAGAMTLRRGQQVHPGERVAVVEDVLTTGGSAQETAAVVAGMGAEVVAYGALVDRSSPDRPLAFRARSLVRVEARTWEAGDCPLCAKGEPIDSPGSRRSHERGPIR